MTKLTTEKEIIVELILQLESFAELLKIEKQAKERAYRFIESKGFDYNQPLS